MLLFERKRNKAKLISIFQTFIIYHISIKQILVPLSEQYAFFQCFPITNITFQRKKSEISIMKYINESVFIAVLN